MTEARLPLRAPQRQIPPASAARLPRPATPVRHPRRVLPITGLAGTAVEEHPHRPSHEACHPGPLARQRLVGPAHPRDQAGAQMRRLDPPEEQTAHTLVVAVDFLPGAAPQISLDPPVPPSLAPSARCSRPASSGSSSRRPSLSNPPPPSSSASSSLLLRRASPSLLISALGCYFPSGPLSPTTLNGAATLNSQAELSARYGHWTVYLPFGGPAPQMRNRIMGPGLQRAAAGSKQ